MIYTVNGIVLSIFALGLVLDHYTHYSLLRWVGGGLIYCLSAVNWLVFFQAVTRIRIPLIVLALLSLAYTTVLAPSIVYVAHLFGFTINQSLSFIALGAVFAVPLVCLIVYQLITKTFSLSFKFANPFKEKKHPLLIILGLVLIFLIVNYALYRFIPETDGYIFLGQIDQLMRTGVHPTPGYRPLFVVFSSTFAFISGIDPYYLFKFLLPFSLLSVVLTTYAFLREELSKAVPKWVIVIGSLLPLSVPVIVEESLYPRPQSISILLLPLILYCCYLALRKKQMWSFIAVIPLALVAIKLHEINFLFLVPITITGLVLYWPQIRRNPWLSLGLLSYGLIGLAPYIQQSSVLHIMADIAGRFIESFSKSGFRWWFISNYINSDGVQMGWPGYSWIFYYGYNLGLIIPFVFIMFWFFKDQVRRYQLVKVIPYLVSALLFFAIAEILPRFNFSYLPDRAWLFLMLSIAPLAALAFAYALSCLKRQFSIITLIIFVATFAVAPSLTYIKKGWITNNEYDASQWIRHNLPDDAIIISQPGNYAMIGYFSKRRFVPAYSSVFSSNGIDQSSLASLTEYTRRSIVGTAAKQEIAVLAEKIAAPCALESSAALDQSLKQCIATKSEHYSEFLKAYRDMQIPKTYKYTESSPMYLLYSTEKFKGLYGNREWWRFANGWGFDPALVSSSYELVRANSGIYIWKIK